MKRRMQTAASALARSLLAFAALALGAGAQTPQAPAQTQAAPASPSAQVPDEVAVNSTTVARRVPPKPGDICLICNHPVEDDDVVFLVRGQRVPIHLSELATDLRAQLRELLGQLEPRGAFIGAEQSQPTLSSAWFFMGLYILAGLVFAALCAHRALHVGHSPFVWFVVGLVLNAFGYLLLRTRPKHAVPAPAGVPSGLRKIAATYAPHPCPGCGTLNHPSASACSGCGGKLEPKTVSEVARVGLRPA